jgi:NAD-dependent deacetylase
LKFLNFLFLSKFRLMKKIVVFTGSGISAESGIKTFRESGGLWEEYDIMQVATPEAWKKNPGLVQDFYNKRRKQVLEARPNEAHIALAELEKRYEVQIITQNIDDLHERAGSSNVLHLHGEIRKARSTRDPRLIYDIEGWEIRMGDLCEKGSQLRPHIVWFGETVPEIEKAALLSTRADIFIVIGTSLNVYPAAGLVEYAPFNAEKYLVDPNEVGSHLHGFILIKDKAASGVRRLAEILMSR